ncbi:SAM-dependent methyltransferase [Pontibacter ummariensis]|uniref:SAM-dependent methyltransferase n=1 Tax=Pontibacter ummariensis TaxID=1610492 RepID=A0A239BS99_9BACT|nr:class I SAM-dependent rRNA methyltransferase [Pontibacter ummariensis]PRY15659.1 SAM-dependent methyltransferase [Pontibacter ummariensis]SNS10542.1 SAM-dependent methyltransferase [Pontibacter ummariensis]
MSYIKLYLAPGKEHSLQRQHPWVFSGAIRKADGEPEEGEIVEVYSSKREFLGMGHFAPGSIAVRIFSFEQVEPDYAFWKSKVEKAYAYRQRLGLIENPHTDVYRLVYAEGDGVPGLIVDVYKDTAVVQTHSVGMYLIREHIARALQEIYGKRLKAVYDKSAESLPLKRPIEVENGYLYGASSGGVVVTENENQFFVDWESGQKTGFFIDQRENRELLARYVKGKSVLNTFCYTGGFSVYALNAGAKEVHSVDVSKKAIELTVKNGELSQAPERHEAFAVDTFDFLKGKEDIYDVIILDPPAFAKSQKVRHNALMGYKRLNAEAMKKIKPGGILFTFSCSQVVDRYLFNSTVMAAAIDAGRNIKIMHQLSQPADHPVSIFHPEGEYLKGLVLFVE